MTDVGSDAWYESAFEADYLDAYARRDAQEARDAVGGLIRLLGDPLAGTVVDVGCGAGRHLVGLEEAGWRTVGIDLSRPLLAAARSASPAARLVRADMRRLPLAQSFDLAVFLFTTIGYFEDDAANALPLEEAFRVLKPGGRVVIDYMNTAAVLRNLVPRSERSLPGGGRLIEWRQLSRDGKRLLKLRRTDADGPRSPARLESVRAYRKDEVVALLTSAGFVALAVWGSMTGEPWHADAPRLVMIGTKPAPP